MKVSSEYTHSVLVTLHLRNIIYLIIEYVIGCIWGGSRVLKILGSNCLKMMLVSGTKIYYISVFHVVIIWSWCSLVIPSQQR